MKENEIQNTQSDFVIYETDDNVTKVNVRLDKETVWLTQAHLVELFQSSKANISEHIKHIFEEGELSEKSVVRKFRTTDSDGKNYEITEFQALEQNPMTMRDWVAELDKAILIWL